MKLKYSAGYKLHIKFNEQEINKSENKDTNLEQNLNELNSLIDDFNNYLDYFKQNSVLNPYLKVLIKVLEKIKAKTNKISLYLVGQDFSFELVIQIINENKKELFSEILSMKNDDNTIDELTISMQSLENILTSI